MKYFGFLDETYHVGNCTTRLFYVITRSLGLKKLLFSFALISFSLCSSFTFGLASTEDMDQNQNQFVNSKDFNFVAAGDFGCNEDAKKTTQVMANENPEILIALGDLTESKSADCWFDMISLLKNVSNLKISFGWHDVSSDEKTYSQYLKHFNLTEPYHSFDYNNVHFLAMATAKNKVIPYNDTSEQYQFIKNDLIEANNNKNINWIVVLSYRPFYSSNTTHPGLDKLQNDYHELFDKYNVDIVLQAHNHNYQRTYPLSYNPTEQFAPIITDKNTDHYRNLKNGQIFFTVGTGGAEFYNFTGQAPFVIKQFLRHGFLNIASTDGGSKLFITFNDNDGIIRDQIDISKTDNITWSLKPWCYDQVGDGHQCFETEKKCQHEAILDDAESPCYDEDKEE